ncbi:MAG: OmpH family outer membrane protein [Paracoccaceae bacterium]|nr:OmpH family outer membrane protein [Paracoccaceae bacterium]MDE2914982.1 OmpH family outer membrane protein [Paracoccaceae bacterium]
MTLEGWFSNASFVATALFLAGFAAAPTFSLAQGVAPPLVGGGLVSVAVINQERLFNGSAEGQRIIAEFDRQANELARENRQLERQLGAEERELTERRKSADPDEFRGLAAEFDRKVNGIRAAQKRKLEALFARREQSRSGFLTRAVPVLLSAMRERGIKIILNQQAVLLATDDMDITDEAIEWLDRAFPIEQDQGEDP